MSPNQKGFALYATRFLIICLTFGGFALTISAQNVTKFAENSAVTKSGNQITINWRTEYEVNTLGFNVWREINGEKTRITPEIIAGSLLQNGQNVASTAGNDYVWTDNLPNDFSNSNVSNLRYWIEEINDNNQSVLHGAFSPKMTAKRNFNAKKSLLISDLNVLNIKTANEFETHFPAFDSQKIAETNSASLEKQKFLANDAKAVKFLVSRDGFYRIARSQLALFGIDSIEKADFLSLYVDGEEQSLNVNADGSIEFYAQTTDNRFTKNRVYWLAVGTQHGKRMSFGSNVAENNSEIAGANLTTNFLDVVERRDKKILANSVLNGETENFFGGVINSAGLTQTLSIVNPITDGDNATLEVAIQGLTDGQHDIHVQLNNIELGSIQYENQQYATKKFSIAASSLVNGTNNLSFTDGSSDTSVIDYARLTYVRTLKPVNNKLNFSIAANQTAFVIGFDTPEINFYDVTNPSNVQKINATPKNNGKAGYSFTIAASGFSRKIIALKSDSFDRTIKLMANNASHLNDANNDADFVIIAHRNFLNAAEPLKTLRESQGLKTQIIDVEDIYDEFAFGLHTPHAIHDFLMYATKNWTTKPHYVLLIGDSTNDPRNYFGNSATDFVPTYVADSYYGEAASDTEMMNLNEDDGFVSLEDIAFGRLSVKTQTEADNTIKKILDYENRPKGDTVQRGAILLSDSFDGYNFEEFTAQIRDFLPPNMPQQIINRSEGTSADVRAKLLTATNNGAGIINFMGHGSSSGWTSASLLNTNDAPNLTNNPRQTFVVALACLNGSFTETQDTFAESMVKSPNGGAIAMLSSTGLTLPYGQVIAMEKLYDVTLFGNDIRLGDAVRQAKAANTDLDVRRLMVLFGDPTMKIK